eukprot:scaffold8224_cov118-Isochrysis_galbana.AAC.20
MPPCSTRWGSRQGRTGRLADDGSSTCAGALLRLPILDTGAKTVAVPVSDELCANALPNAMLRAPRLRPFCSMGARQSARHSRQ